MAQMAQRENPARECESAGLSAKARMAQRENPALESAGLGAMARMAQRENSASFPVLQHESEKTNMEHHLREERREEL